MKSLLGKMTIIPLITLFFFIFICPKVSAFEVDGFKSGMTKEEVRRLLKSYHFDKIEDKEGGIYAYDIPIDRTHRSYGLFFYDDKLVLLHKNFPPSIKKFIFLFDRFSALYGKPFDSNSEVRIESHGESRRIIFYWSKMGEIVSLHYIVFPNNDDLHVIYEIEKREKSR